MNAQEIRRQYLEFFQQRGHSLIPRAQLVPQNDPTTLFIGSGMQPLLPYLLGKEHPEGNRLVDSQTSFRAEDVDDVGDNRHTTFFEMLGNWSLGDYFKKEQIQWFFEFLVDVVGLDPSRIYVSCFIGDESNNIPRDDESAKIWQELFESRGIEAKIVEIGSSANGDKIGMQGGRIFFYDAKENWWSRAGVPANMASGEPGGSDSEVFFDFGEQYHDESKWGLPHPANDSGRFMEIGNQVFMEYVKNESGDFEYLPKKNIDFGGGLERISAAAIDSPDVFRISIMWPVIEKLQLLSGKKYEDHTESMRVITDHLRAATFLAVDGVVPSNNQQGYVMRRLLRRAIRYAFELGLDFNICEQIVPVVADMYRDDFPEVESQREQVVQIMIKEEKVFRQTLKAGVKQLQKLSQNQAEISGADIFKLYDTYGFPKELSLEETETKGFVLTENWQEEFEAEMTAQKERSRSATKGQFKGGLEGTNPMHVKYHTTTHVMYRALRTVLGDHVEQRGSNITEERARFDFNHHEKMTPEQIKEVEDIVNKVIDDDLPVTYEDMPTDKALTSGARGHFGDKYGETSRVYTIGGGDNVYSKELCGGPHVEHTGVLGEDGKSFKIIKEQSSSAGIRRIKAVLK
jgi:alanyl-tRNA synthetase